MFLSSTGGFGGPFLRDQEQKTPKTHFNLLDSVPHLPHLVIWVHFVPLTLPPNITNDPMIDTDLERLGKNTNLVNTAALQGLVHLASGEVGQLGSLDPSGYALSNP